MLIEVDEVDGSRFKLDGSGWKWIIVEVVDEDVAMGSGESEE